MRRPALTLAATIAIVLAALVSFAQQTTAKPAPTVKQIMLTKIIPFSDAVFGAQSEPPTTAAQWTALRGPALGLVESGRLLMVGPRSKDKVWMKMAQQEVDAAQAVMKAAAGKDAEGLSLAADALYETCKTCHDRYMSPKPKGP